MLILSLFWFLIGLFIGAMANAAKLRPVAWVRGGRLGMLGLGALVALLGGWLGTWLFGTLFATATAIWVAVLGVALLPRFIMMCNSWLHSRSAVQ
ncbi:MAG TPA: hypothetical protein VEH81_12230 [Ktedonobacteraceae bacterium]|nr:hypothetical protein [Ktedonobacteraceae bacterium]HXZ05596.1 hypothetical protein [Ktedonobacteraceae bacterium]